MKTFEFHPLANLFPLIEGEEFERLADDIAANGLNDDIVLYQGKILDGRNRYKAVLARRGSVPDELTSDYSDEFENEAEALAWVLSKNLHRRHLTSGQRAMIAANIATMKSGTRTDLKQDGAKEQPDANLREVQKTDAQEVSIAEAAEKLQVSPRSVDSAKKVLTQGAAELADAVSGGKLAVSAAAAIADLPVDEQVKAIASADPKAFAKVAKARRDKKTAEKKAKRTEREKELGKKQRALPAKKFGVIYADPEWKFEPYSDKTGMDRAADNHYPTSAIEAIKARPVGDIAADDCALFLWTTVPMLGHALDVLNEWGFQYRSQFIWCKPKAGTGYWNRNKHEVLLLGTRGNVPCPAPGTQWDSLIDAPVGRHSEKPEIFHFLIESYFPSLPKIELNARNNRPGWTVWGLEADEEDVSGEPLLQMPLVIKKFTIQNTKGKKHATQNQLRDGQADNEQFGETSVSGFERRGKRGDGKNQGPRTGVSNLSRLGGGKPDGAIKGNKPGKNQGGRSRDVGGQSNNRIKKPNSPIVARVNIDDLELLVRVADEKISFYAMQDDALFPAETGVVTAHCVGEVTAAKINAISQKIWAQEFANKASASILDTTWRLPTTTYRMGRSGPIPT